MGYDQSDRAFMRGLGVRLRLPDPMCRLSVVPRLTCGRDRARAELIFDLAECLSILGRALPNATRVAVCRALYREVFDQYARWAGFYLSQSRLLFLASRACVFEIESSPDPFALYHDDVFLGVTIDGV